MCNKENTYVKILFLTNNSNTVDLYSWLQERAFLCIWDKKLDKEIITEMQPDMVISYNYRYIINKNIIDYMQGKIYNLHISYLPWNKGASPNIWSFIDNTPKGVTIHQISEGLDEGKILYQKECFFDPEKESFSTVYNKLHWEIVNLFKENWNDIRENKYSLKEQEGVGSHHTKKDLEELKRKLSFAWSDNIADFLKEYQAIKGK